MQASHILTRNYSVIESRFTSLAYGFCVDPLNSPDYKKYCITQCLVCTELDMTSMKTAVSYFNILFLNSPEETEENQEITKGNRFREGDFNPRLLENKTILPNDLRPLVLRLLKLKNL